MTTEQAKKNIEIINIIFRTLLYSTILFFSMCISGEYFGDTYLANLSVFTLFLATYELIMTKVKGTFIRQFLYIVIVVLSLISGLFLLKQSIILNSQEILEESKEPVRAMFYHTNAMVLGINDNLIVENYSEEFILQTGFSPEDIVGKKAEELFSSKFVLRLKRIKEELIYTNKDWLIYVNKYNLSNVKKEISNYKFEILALRYTFNKIKGNIQFIILINKE